MNAAAGPVTFRGERARDPRSAIEEVPMHASSSAARALAAACLALAAGAAAAQDVYPSRPVKIVVTFPPGGPSDIIARTVGDKLAGTLKQPFIVENRGGAGGNIGAGAVAAAAPDGYTILFGIDTTFTVNPSLYKSMPFKLDALTPLMLLGASGLTVGVHPSVGVGTLKELVAKGQREPLAFSSGSNGSPGHLAASTLVEKTGMKITHVPYKGNTPAVTAVVSGEVQAGILATPGFLPQIQAGKVKALAVTSRARSPLLPDAPTVAEAGLPDLELEVLYVAYAPAGTPEPILQLLQREMGAALKLPDVRERFRNLDIEVLGEPGPVLGERIARTRERYARTINATGMKID
jgi:tripartite-type tricarboxylate transporter receptor subunit TctC